MKILLVSYFYDKGGIQTHTRYLAKGLVELGHSVRIISPRPMTGHSSLQKLGDGISFETYDGLASAVLISRRETADVAIVIGTGWKAMVSVALLPRSCRKVFFEVMSGIRRRRFDPRCCVHFGFDAIVGQATSVASRFESNFGWRGKTAIIPALPEPLELNQDIPTKSARELSGEVPIRFAFFSRLAAHKRADLLIERWHEYAPLGSCLDIWGGGPEVANLERMIQQRSLGHSIALRGRYPSGASYVKLLQSYDLLLLPTVGDEGAPLVLLEAMACGLPFVANGVGGIPDYANDDCIVTSGQIEEFVPAVITMVDRLKRGTVYTDRLQRHYMRHFSFERLLARWVTFLTHIVNANSTGVSASARH